MSSPPSDPRLNRRSRDTQMQPRPSSSDDGDGSVSQGRNERQNRRNRRPPLWMDHRSRHRSGPGPPVPGGKPFDPVAFLADPPDTPTSIPVYHLPRPTRVNPDQTDDCGDGSNYIPYGPVDPRPTNAITTFVLKQKKEIKSSESSPFSISVLATDFEIRSVDPKQDETLDRSLCCICLGVTLRQLFCCENGHIVCNVCRWSLLNETERNDLRPRCPTCRGGRVIPSIRNFELEEMLKNAEIYCGYRSLGCLDTYSLSELRFHKKLVCSSRPWKCYFCEKELTFSTFEDHFLEIHLAQFSEWLNPPACSFSVQLPMKSCGFGLAYSMINFGTLGLFVLLQIEVSERRYLYALLKMDMVLNCADYEVKTVITAELTAMECVKYTDTWKHRVASGLHRMPKILRQLDWILSTCGLIELDLNFRHLCTFPPSKFTMTVDVSKKNEPLYKNLADYRFYNRPIRMIMTHTRDVLSGRLPRKPRRIVEKKMGKN